jgi:hypothetical protein
LLHFKSTYVKNSTTAQTSSGHLFRQHVSRIMGLTYA